jgi:hypothetical protein
MRHTLDEASMLEILAAAESDTRLRTGPRSPEMSACRRADKTRAARSAAAGGEQQPVPGARGGEPGHGEQQIPQDVLSQQPRTRPAAGSRPVAARQDRIMNDPRDQAGARESQRASSTAVLVMHQAPVCDDCGLWWPI